MKCKKMKKGLRFLLVLVLAVLMLAGCSATTEAQETTVMPTYEVLGTEPETLPPVQITMPEYELAYSGDLEDVIVVKEMDDHSGLEFSVKLSTGEAHIFTLYYNSQEGDLVTMLTDADGNKIPVAFLMAAVPEEMNEGDAQTFYAAQEAVNEIVASLTLK